MILYVFEFNRSFFPKLYIFLKLLINISDFKLRDYSVF